MATIVNVQDPTTITNNLAIDSSGRIGINNWPGVQMVTGTVQVAFFPANQVVSGTIDVTDRPARSLGIVTIASGGIGTNTAPSYSIIQDGTNNARKMAVNADGSINISGTISATNPSVGTNGSALAASSTLIGASDGTLLQQLLVESASNRNLRIGIYSGANEATVTGANALKVDGSGVTQPVSVSNFPGTQTVTGTITANIGTAGTLALEGGNLATLASIVTGAKAAVNVAQVAGSTISNTNPVPVQDIEQSGYTTATSPPTTTNAGSDTSYTFSSQVNLVIIQNNTSANVNYAFDTAASAGSLVLVPGAMLVYPKKCTVLHLFTAAAQNINGTSAANLVVLGAL